MKNFFRKLHLWLSVPFGLVIFITCLTGAILVFEKEITSLCGGTMTVEPQGSPLPLDVIAERLSPDMEDGAEITGFVIPGSPDEAYRVNVVGTELDVLLVNQYTGEQLGRQQRLPLFDVVFRLHRWLMDGGSGDGALYWGKTIVGLSTLCFVVILIAGIVIWWPKNRKMLQNRLSLVVNKGKNRFWHDLHVAGGFYAFLFLLVFALTGLTWSFEWYRNGVYDLFGTETVDDRSCENVQDEEPVCIGNCRKCTLDVCVYVQPAETDGANGSSQATTAWSPDAVSGATTAVQAGYLDESADDDAAGVDAMSGATGVMTDAVSAATAVVEDVGSDGDDDCRDVSFVAWQAALNAVMGRVTDFSQMTVSDGSVSVLLSEFGNSRAYDTFVFNEETGVITSYLSYDDSARLDKVGGWIYSLHVGSWGGLVTRVLAFLAALLGATLPLTGYYFWIRRLYIKHKAKQ